MHYLATSRQIGVISRYVRIEKRKNSGFLIFIVKLLVELNVIRINRCIIVERKRRSFWRMEMDELFYYSDFDKILLHVIFRVWKIMFVQRESEQQFAILNDWNRGSNPCNNETPPTPMKPASARDRSMYIIHQRPISGRYQVFSRDRILATTICSSITNQNFFSFSSFRILKTTPIDLWIDRETTTLALQSSTKYLSSTYFFCLTWYSDALSTLRTENIFLLSFLLFFLIIHCDIGDFPF